MKLPKNAETILHPLIFVAICFALGAGAILMAQNLDGKSGLDVFFIQAVLLCFAFAVPIWGLFMGYGIYCHRSSLE